MSTNADQPARSANGTGSPSLLVVEGSRSAIFLERPNKYLAVVELDGARTEAFIPNPGRMKELLVPGREVLLRPASGGTARRTRFDLAAVRYLRRFVLIDSGVPNRFLKHLLKNQSLPELAGWDLLKAESKWGNSQFDFLLGQGEARCLLEAKCCTYVVDGVARFPDAPTTRGTRHVRELIEARRAGYRAVVLLLIQGVGASSFRPNHETDPAFAAAFYDALDAGVEIYARVLRFRGGRIYLGERLEPAPPRSLASSE